MARNWFTVKAASGDKPATISIYDEIGMWGVTAKDFIASFRAIESNKITLEINSPGGSVFDALAMFNALKNSGKDITVVVMGIAASAASYIAMVGKKIIMPENTFMMVHNPMNGVWGNADDMREMADILDKIGASLTATYVARSGKTPEEIGALLSSDSYLTAAECKALGFADEVSPAITATAKFEAEHLPENIRAMFTAKAPDAEPAPTTPAVAFADQVVTMCVTGGMADFAALWALDDNLDTLDKVAARMGEAREINALCAVAKRPDDAAKFIRGGKTVAEARAALCAALAESDINIDTTVKTSIKPSTDAQPSAVTPSGMWAARRSTSGVKK